MSSNQNRQIKDVNLFYLSAAFLLLSGIASLTYQVTWVRLLGLSMGSTSAAISTVLAAFFMGLALGSYLAERITRNRIDNFRPYIFLEIIIGISGLALLPVLLNLDAVMALMPELGSTLPMKFVITMALLILPTLCMGATFPVMASIMIRREAQMGLRMSQLYSLNTAGAVAGACLSGFVFIPNWGLDGSIFIAFTINIGIVLVALYINRNLTLPAIEPVSDTKVVIASASANVNTKEQAPLRLQALVVLFFTGFVAIATEVGWTKFLVIFAGTTIYGFAAILTIFLTGIAAGSWAIKSRIETMSSPQTWMAVGLVLLGASLLMTRAGLSFVPNIYQAINHFPAPDFIVHSVKYSFIFLLLFIPTFLFGALFPINLRLYCGNLSGVRSRIGKAYAVNTLASIFGSILAGFWIIPELGTDWLLTAMAALILILPFFFIRSIVSTKIRVAVVVFTFIAVTSNWIFPHLDYKQLIASVGYDRDLREGKKPEFLYLKEGKAGVVSMITFDGVHVKLQNNGLNESFIDMEDEYNSLIVESLLGLMPYFLHEDPKKAFVVGFGGGITTKALTYTDLQSIRVVELEPSVVDAGRAIMGGEIAALKDPRVQLNFNDARNTLLVEKDTYDIIVAQPSHPWRAGAANVFTKEFFNVVKSRLNPDGIYGQWINLFNMDVTTLRALLNSFVTVFPEAVSFADIKTGDFLIFGSQNKLVFDFDRVSKRTQRENIAKLLAKHNLYQPEHLLWYFGLSREEMVKAIGQSPLNTDTNILSEVRLSRIIRRPTGDEDPYKFLVSHFTFDVLPYLKEEQAPPRLFKLGQYLMHWNSLDIAKLLAKQITKINEQWGRGLEYEILWQTGNLEAAIEFYDQHDEWLDGTRKSQIVVLADLGRIRKAEQIVSKIKEKDQRRLAAAYLMYAKRDWQALANVKPLTDYEKKWQLIGLAQQDLKSAGAQLEKLIADDSTEIPQLRVLVKYFAMLGQASKMDNAARQLVEAIQKQTKQLSEFAEAAMEEGNLKWAQSILHKMERLHSQAKTITDLKEKIDTLRLKESDSKEG
ncbi:MAG: hypothetical protein GXP19_06075 [Gammaproteobacteria bacterium]|nr:hypothetical protein [Gammaproteobacteria bacterium]